VATTSLPSARISGATLAAQLSGATAMVGQLWTALVLLLAGLLPGPRATPKHAAPRRPRPVVRVERGAPVLGGVDVVAVGPSRGPDLLGALRSVFPDRRSLWLPAVLVAEFVVGVLIGVLT